MFAQQVGEVWEVTLDQRSWQGAAEVAVTFRNASPLPGYRVLTALIKPRGVETRSLGRRCQLVMRFRRHDDAPPLTSGDHVLDLLEPFENVEPGGLVPVTEEYLRRAVKAAE